MDLEKIMQEVNGKEITSSQDYFELNFNLRQLEETANSILDYLTFPKKENNREQVLVTSDQINSKYLKNLADAIETIDEKLWNYRQSNPQPSSREIIYESYSDKENLLLMYSSYLKSRKNPKVLNNDELKRIKKHPFNPTKFQIDISEEKYNKINKSLDNIEYNVIPKAILFPINMTFKILGGAYRIIKKLFNPIEKTIDNFFDKYKYNESGTLPEERFGKRIK